MHILGALGPPDFFNQSDYILESCNIFMTLSPVVGQLVILKSSSSFLDCAMSYRIQMLLERKIAIPHHQWPDPFQVCGTADYFAPETLKQAPFGELANWGAVRADCLETVG